MMRRVVVGAFLGLAWGATLRAWMTLLALVFGDRPQYTWLGAFGAILLPAALMGAMLGWATWAAETPDATSAGNPIRKRWRWAILSPLVMFLAPAILIEDLIPAFLATGLGGGAIAVALIGMLGGYALSGFGMLWMRWLSGLLALLFSIVIGASQFFGYGVAEIRLSAGEAFGSLFYILLMALLIAGVSAPFRNRPKQPVSE